MAARRTRAGGFTLVELLVVIAIIAILMAIVFPVFNRARENARQTHCMANLHNLAQAIRMYRMDEGSYPGPYDPVTGLGGLNALYPGYVSSRESFLCPNDPMLAGDVQNGYLAQRVVIYLPDGVSDAQPPRFMRDLVARADAMYLDRYGQPMYLDPTTRQLRSYSQLWSDPVFFREHYSSYNVLFNYIGYVNYPQDPSIDITRPRTFTLCSQLFGAGSGSNFMTGDSPAFWAAWYFWDPQNVLGAEGGIDNLSGSVSQRDKLQRWLPFDLAQTIYWPDLDPGNLSAGNTDSVYRLRDDLGRPLWELDVSGNTTAPVNWDDLNQQPYGVPSAVFPGLINRDAPDNTIVTRCMYHRTVSRTARDIVLRLDGSAQLVPGLKGYNWARQSELTH